ncbi:MAG: hypothetical protein WBD31_13840 [Rubripirellula sp.]
MTINESVKIRLTWGLVAALLIQAVAIGVMHSAIKDAGNIVPSGQHWNVPNRSLSVSYDSPIGSPIETLQQPANVNLQAQGELKQQSPSCPDCNARPLYINGERVVRIGPEQSVNPTNVNAFPVSQASYPAMMPAVGASTSTTPSKSYQIALFLDETQQSQQLRQWFDEHPSLQKLRQVSDFQIYTARNTLYKTRYAEIVPVEQFPVVLFQDSTGGHIHAAGRTMIPSTPNELWDDIRKGQQLWKQAKSGSAQMTGAIKSKGYSWDAAINPAMQLSSSDCPDGYYPTPDASWRPGDRLRPDSGGDLFDTLAPGRNAFLWANSGDIATLALTALAVGLVIFILIKRSL